MEKESLEFEIEEESKFREAKSNISNDTSSRKGVVNYLYI